MRHNLVVRETAGPTLALFASVSTLLCCALPALLITIGAGAVMAGLATNVPGLIWLSSQKEWAFGFAGLMLAIATYVKWHTRNAPCPMDMAKAKACGRLRRWGSVMLALAWIAYLTGGFFAFFAADLLL